ncbi:recombinase family protein [Bradyrhizobium sp. 4]|uniref:recombinase family protein n=1 Tax=unclassified Bradyrhizobium TaxID=2631580 RepID=UPI001FFA4C0B|nr:MULTISPECIES: recombinase family protein [unclassified Bradyrhizobium]MCK1397094.1 recombinase family protein [Bradyrhizobium sp. 39]MCK1752868.1 recombinase family protein [Bradyrhizobium sp. 135]UPJ37065.1 recombinase family protein [Bradyrhizobium sp. 4]
MPADLPRTLRCAIYTRKSTEHGLDQEFNSLDAQREACEAYIKSQALQGWKLVPAHYDDPAYSGGNLERPALKRLLRDIELGNIDVVVVYKIDRLTRSLADFAKIVETFDATSVSFVAVTQQFNTTTSMGRLTLNILLSFAQFERELASERVKDKIAASRKKGKWTGGTVPLGYDAKDKKLVVNKTEAESVRTMFQLYLEHRSFGKLVGELDRRGIVTKRRMTKVAKYQGGIPFTYGPLAYFLKNRVYLGEIHHGGKWFKGEHAAILDRATFDQVQQLLKENSASRGTKFSESGALLKGKLFDDNGNRMGPTFSSKNGVRYRFFTSNALRGRQDRAGSVSRVSAPEIETLVEAEVRRRLEIDDIGSELFTRIERVTILKDSLQVTLNDSSAKADPIKIPWTPRPKTQAQPAQYSGEIQADPKLLKAIIRAHAWLRALSDGDHASIEELAESVSFNPKVIRQSLRLAFLPPEMLTTVLRGDSQILLRQIPKLLPLAWQTQRQCIS